MQHCQQFLNLNNVGRYARNYSRSDLFRNSNGELHVSLRGERTGDENSSLTLDSLSLRTCFPPSGGVLKRLIELWTRSLQLNLTWAGWDTFFSANEENYLTFSSEKGRLDFWIFVFWSRFTGASFVLRLFETIRWNRNLITTTIWFGLLYRRLKID